MKKIIALVAALCMVFALCACGSSSAPAATSAPAAEAPAAEAPAADAPAAGGPNESLTFVTGGETGTYYAFGSVIAQYVSANTNLSVTAVSGNGSKANVEDMDAGAYQLGFCQSDVMSYAHDGTNIFAETGAVDSFSAVAALYMEQVQIVTINPDIKTVEDLRGKSVSIGAQGSGVYFNAVDVLGCYDMTIEDITPVYQSFGDSADSLKDGKIDAAFIVAGAPTTAVADLAATKSVNLVSLDDEHIAKLLESSPYYTKCVIPAETYGMAGDVTTVGVGAVVLVRDDVSEDAVYALCADIFDNAASLVDTHAKYGEISLDYGASMTAVPYHAGAAKYFAEKGFTVPTK